MIELRKGEKAALKDLVDGLREEDDPERIQNLIFLVARRNGVSPGRFFRILYKILLGMPHGPRLGPYIVSMGKENVLKSLIRVLETPEKGES